MDVGASVSDRLVMAARLGHIDGATAMLDPQPSDLAARVAALRLLRRLWGQFTLDRGLPANHICEQTDTAERAVFLPLICETNWPTLGWAAEQVHAMLPAPIDPEAAALVTHEARKRVRLVHATIAEEPLAGPPDVRIAALLARLIALDAGFSESEGQERHYHAGDLHWTRYDPGPSSDAWAINLAIAQDGATLALGASLLPFPAIVRRELCRLDRSPAWREAALIGAIGTSADTVLRALYFARAASEAMSTALVDRRTTSRTLEASVLLAGMETLTPIHLARALGCTRPGAVQILGELARAGLLADDNNPRQARWLGSSQHRRNRSAGWLKAWQTRWIAVAADTLECANSVRILAENGGATMSLAVSIDQSAGAVSRFVSGLQEPRTPYISPERLSAALGVELKRLAALTGVHRNTLRNPASERLQERLREIVKVISAATTLTGDPARSIYWFRNEPLADYDHQTAAELVAHGHVEAVLAHLRELENGANG